MVVAAKLKYRSISGFFQTFYNRCLMEEEQSRAEGNPEIGNVTELCEKPDGFVPNYILLRMWRIVYWTSQLLTW